MAEPEDEAAVKAECQAALRSVAALRAFAMPAADADPPAVHTALRDLRARLDLAETLLAEVVRARRRAVRTHRALLAAADDEYDAEMERLAKIAVRLEYQSVHDRIAMARVKSSPARRSARTAERVADFRQETEDAVRQAYRGMRDIRDELITDLRSYLPWEASMDR